MILFSSASSSSRSARGAAPGLQVDATHARCKMLFTSVSFTRLEAKSFLCMQVVSSVSKCKSGVNAEIKYGSLLKVR